MNQINIENPSHSFDRTGARLRDARLSKGYSLEDLAIATGLTEAEISSIEDGTSDALHHVGRIENALS